MKGQGSHTIDFSYNWNNKLNSMYFTTLRLYNPVKYAVGKRHHVRLKTKDGWITCYGYAVIQDVRKVLGSELNDFISLDTGYSLEETKNILSKMYKGKNIDNTLFSLVLYKYEEKR